MVKEALAWSPTWWLLRLLLAVVVDLERYTVATSLDSTIAPSDWGLAWKQASPSTAAKKSKEASAAAVVQQQRIAIKADIKFKDWASQATHLNAISANLRRCIRCCIRLGPWCVALGEEWVGGWILDEIRKDLELPTLRMPTPMTAPYPVAAAAP